MRFIWTVAGDDPDYDNCRAHDINGLFAPMFDVLTTKGYLQEFKAEGFKAWGLYVGHNWFPALGPAALAAKVVKEYNRIAIPGTRLMMNLEQHDPGFIAFCLQEIRRTLPNVGLSWSPEGMQGGWMGDAFVARITSLKVRVVPQAFTGPMVRRESDQILRDLLDRGFVPGQISIFYDAAQLGADWDGYAFTEGRLPRII